MKNVSLNYVIVVVPVDWLSFRNKLGDHFRWWVDCTKAPGKVELSGDRDGQKNPFFYYVNTQLGRYL